MMSWREDLKGQAVVPFNGQKRNLPLFICLVCITLFLSCDSLRSQIKPPDEARLANKSVASFPAADENYFADMDGGAKLSPEEMKGRNTWIVWSGGNDRFWDDLSRISFGTLDFLKTLSSHPSLKFSRDNRWYYLGLVNEPCF